MKFVVVFHYVFNIFVGMSSYQSVLPSHNSCIISFAPIIIANKQSRGSNNLAKAYKICR